MKPESVSKIKYGVWGIIVGSIIVMITGFAWGGWTTSGTTQKMNEAAVLDSQAEICVGQFMAQTDHQDKLKEMGALESWKRAEYIEKGGWDKMPGQTEKPDYTVSRVCADGLGAFIKK